MMMTSTASKPSSNGRACETKSRRDRLGNLSCANTNHRYRRYEPVGEVLPPSVVDELRAAVAGEKKVTMRLAEVLSERFSMDEQYGVSRCRLRNFLNTLLVTSAGTPENADCDTGDGKDGPEAWEQKLGAHRVRQASVAAILDQTFGVPARCSPDLWERRAYLLLVGLVYERLATGEDEISTDELVKLAKALAENRRVEARLRDGKQRDEPTESDPPPAGELPPRFAEIVRQVYGTNFHSPTADLPSKNGGAGG